jgi:PAS domain S-box-containing protein
MTQRSQSENTQPDRGSTDAALSLIPLAVLEQAVDGAQLGFARVDAATETIVDANPLFCRLLGYTPDQMTGGTLRFRDLTHPADLARCLEQLLRLLAIGIESCTLEHRYVRKDRTVLPMRSTFTALERDGTGELLIIGVISAPADRGFAAVLPRYPGNPLRASFWTQDLVSRTAGCSDGFKVLLGRPVDGPLPSLRQCVAQVHPDDRLRVVADLQRARRGLYHCSEFRVLRSDGELRHVVQTVTPVLDPSGEVTGMVGGCIDVSDAKRLASQTPSTNTVRIVQRHVDLNWHQPLSITTLAAAAGLNARTLFKHFKQACGFTPQDYIKQVRLKHARAMLQMGDRATTVLEVALKCCFNNQGHFAHDYRLAFGERPSDTLERARRTDATRSDSPR